MLSAAWHSIEDTLQQLQSHLSSRIRTLWHSIQNLSRKLRGHLLSRVASDIVLEMELMVLSFCTGIVDAITFPDFHVFTSNQTGNTALLAVGALDIGGGIVDLRHVGTSLGIFLAGGLLLGQLGRLAGPDRRAWLLLTNLIQTALVFGAAGIHSYTDRHTWGVEGFDLAIIGLLAFASGAQVAAARGVRMPEIPTAMVTSAYIDLVIDPRLFGARNRARNRRLVFVVSLAVGSFVGASAYKYVSPAFGLYLAGIGKAMVCIAFLFNPRARVEQAA